MGAAGAAGCEGAGHAVECSPRYEHGGEAGASPGVRRTARQKKDRSTNAANEAANDHR